MKVPPQPAIVQSQAQESQSTGKSLMPPPMQLTADPIQRETPDGGGGGGGGGNPPAISPPMVTTPVIAADNTSVAMPGNVEAILANTAVTGSQAEAPEVAAPTLTNDSPAAYKLGITQSVGKGGTNAPADVAIVRAKLMELKLLTADQTDQASLETAIIKFQTDILKLGKPDGKITPGGKTDRAMVTAYVPAPASMTSIVSARAEFKHTIKTSEADFATSLAGATLNGSSTADTVSVGAILAVQKRLGDSFVRDYTPKTFKNADLMALKDKAVADMTPEEKQVVATHVAATVKQLKKLQSVAKLDVLAQAKQGKGSSIYYLTETTSPAPYTAGQISGNDATFIYLRDYKTHTLSWTGDDGSTHSVRGTNMVNSVSAVTKEGVAFSGKEKSPEYDAEKFAAAGNVTGKRAEALLYGSSHEGGFDAINTWDRAVLSYGFIQFAGGPVGNVSPLFAKIKADSPGTWQAHYQKYGIDVEYQTNESGRVLRNTCQVVAFKEDGTKLTGIEAEKYIAATPAMLAALMKGAEYDEVKNAEIKYAMEGWIEVAENTPLGLTLNILKVDGTPPTILSDQKEIDAFKKTPAFTTGVAAGNIHESTWGADLKNVLLKEICTSEKDLGALYAVSINNPTAAASAFQKAIRLIIIRDGLTSLTQVKAISSSDLLANAKANLSDPVHKDRVQKAADKESLSGDK